jgi:DNA-binding transcriptional ArsR family regulator
MIERGLAMAELHASERRDDRVPMAMAKVREHAAEAAAFLKALANDQRLLILCALLDGALSVGDINERVPLSQSALSQHLCVMREAGLVTTTRKSQTIYYALARGPALQVMEILYATFCASPAPNANARKAKCRPAKRS